MNQNQIAELFDTSVPNISMHIANILEENELEPNSVIKEYLTTAADGKQYRIGGPSWLKTSVICLEFYGERLFSGQRSKIQGTDGLFPGLALTVWV